MKQKRSLVKNILREARLSKYRLDEIKSLMKVGDISYSQAVEMSKAPLNLLNKGMGIVAKRYGKKHKMVSFSAYMR
ncbi:MAG: hypothetical protein A3A96_03615 [Candidatus Zambryskibacteria bacterium RIFCSPLOWO2_01_FULL_39_39]|uniref:Uncharacterized protein n=1 Tax=Candidatus Zambryskibacteria bacterium RIFCSPLOWO2_01_FULL_39_39 TaxID=1802758 RepID=A0A1G2TXR7_9BACT|nr:MAG: hypothetical protein A2644_00880 [Candidatus Zambryskibacteria bacterium RIFCSPHIGHO2_01_FULL_39_63]OHA94584.1 MAG: hypothetical protein A3B88_00010 [Candidatus Zambryskibacteria bacterium RIFCSPHIGHO2_02_FULL_39_19]OHB02067.1 MAG: hypothetical protein A3A96_03615 [Candidatus Zambryskibacteria bacterium RIFCSPLOWO2_01_FULL_39_39]